MICDGAVIFENCEANLRLEMAASDPRNYTASCPTRWIVFNMLRVNPKS